MNFAKVLAPVALVALFSACTQAGSSDVQSGPAASSALRDIGVVNCSGIANENWVDHKGAAVKVSAKLSVQATASRAQSVSLKLSVPGHFMKGSTEYIHGGEYEISKAGVSKLTKAANRGSSIYTFAIAENQKAKSSTEGATQSYPLSQVSVANGDGADIATVGFVIQISGRAVPVKYSLESCGVSNMLELNKLVAK